MYIRNSENYLSLGEVEELEKLLRAFFTIPYSTDLDGKDAETLVRIVKKTSGDHSRRKELFDIVDGDVGYSVKTLRKKPSATRVDLQEQRFCDVEDVRAMQAAGDGDGFKQGSILLGYMFDRIQQEMERRNVTRARSIILLKDWDAAAEKYFFRYWEEDFYAYVQNLISMNASNEIEWVLQSAGLHGRDATRPLTKGKHPRLIRMHYKHNQIFTDHDIPSDAVRIEFEAKKLSWDEVAKRILET